MQRRHALAGFLGAALAALTSGCGQKGPLYLPSEKLEELERKRREGRGTGGSASAPASG